MMARILVVEDDAGVRRMIDRGLRLAGHEPAFAEDLGAGRDAWTFEGGFDLVLLDVMLPDGNGLELLAARREEGDETPVVLLSAREEAELRERAAAAGATAYLPKPFAYEELVARVQELTTER
jgi:DNA-binding response OmpR family regulator